MTNQVLDIGRRLELFVDDFLLERIAPPLRLQLHHPVPREVALVTDRPWEGCGCGYITVLRDDDRLRLYYKAWQLAIEAAPDGTHKMTEPHPLYVACAESRDGLVWTRPDLGLHPFGTTLPTNIVLAGIGEKQIGTHGFAPFKDPNPDALPDARYKAMGAPRKASEGLYALKSQDGLRWSLLHPEPVITTGKFDSQNLAFWDPVRCEYRAYVRDFTANWRCRGIRTCTSADFIHWTEPEWLEYPGAPEEQLYTNQVSPYYRAPHLFIGFPTRYVERPWSPTIDALPEREHRQLRARASQRYGTAVTDGLFMSSRDGRTFKRWGEAFLRPGLRASGNWAYGDNYQGWGLFETPGPLPGSPPELSFLATEGFWRGRSTTFRRYSLRMDGFVSLSAPLAGGEALTRPLRFEGRTLALNLSTSAAGSARIGLTDEAGQPIPGFSFDEADDLVGDDIERPASWRGQTDLGRLAGQPVRLRIGLRDADLYALRFL